MAEKAPMRAVTHLYSIRGYPNHGYYTGTVESGLQVLIVLIWPRIVILFFNDAGDIVDVQARLASLGAQASAKKYGIREALEEHEAEWLSLLTSMGYHEGPIVVHRFLNITPA